MVESPLQCVASNQTRCAEEQYFHREFPNTFWDAHDGDAGGQFSRAYDFGFGKGGLWSCDRVRGASSGPGAPALPLLGIGVAALGLVRRRLAA